MKAILFIALLFLTISMNAQKFSSGMTKRNTVGATDELLIKAAGNTAPQFTTPIELFNSAQAQSKFLSKTAVLPLTNYISGTAGKIAVFRGDSAVVALSGGTTGQVPVVQSNGTIAFGTVSGGSTALFGESTGTQNITAQTLTDVTSLSLTLAANSYYIVEYQLNCSISAVTTGAGFSLSSNSAVDIDGSIYGAGSATSIINGFIGSSDQAKAGYLTDASMFGTIFFKGTVETSTIPVIITARALKTTSGTLTIWSRSHILATKMR